MSDSEKLDISAESSSEKQTVSPQNDEVGQNAVDSASDHEEHSGDDGKPSEDHTQETSDVSMDISDPKSQTEAVDQPSSSSKPADTSKTEATEVDNSTQADPKSTETNSSSTTSPLSTAEPTHSKVVSDPSPDARPLRGEDDSEDTEQFFTVRSLSILIVFSIFGPHRTLHTFSRPCNACFRFRLSFSPLFPIIFDRKYCLSTNFFQPRLIFDKQRQQRRIFFPHCLL